MTNATIHKIINYFIAAVWLANGLLCKVLNLVPRHGEIISKILGAKYGHPLRIGIGLSEILMAIWILTGIRSRFNAMTQAIIIGTMNIIEFIMVPDLLLWGRFNSVFALLFILLILYNEFVLNKIGRQTR